MKRNLKTVVVHVPLGEVDYNQILSLKNSPTLERAENVILLSIYNDSMKDKLPEELEDKESLDSVASFLSTHLEKTKKNLIPSSASPSSWEVKYMFHPEVKKMAVEFLKEVNAELVVTATRGSDQVPGLFKDTFSFYLVENAPCDIYIVRPVH